MDIFFFLDFIWDKELFLSSMFSILGNIIRMEKWGLWYLFLWDFEYYGGEYERYLIIIVL